MRIALCARVSTSDQTIAPQLDALRTYAERRGPRPSSTSTTACPVARTAGSPWIS